MPNVDQTDSLPLWAWVLLAERAVCRAVVALVPVADDAVRARLLAACDAIERCVRAGEIVADGREAIRRGRDWQPPVGLYSLSLAMQRAVAAAEAAVGALDVGVAEAACVRAVREVAGVLSEDARLPSTQELWERDYRVLESACRAERIGRYDAVPDRVIRSLPEAGSVPSAHRGQMEGYA